MKDLEPPTPSMTQRAKAIQLAMEEIVNIRAKQQVNTALNHRNGPIVTPIHNTPLNSPVLVWREGNTGRSGNWTSPFKLLGIDGETCRIELPSGPTDFRSTEVKPYHQLEPEEEDDNQGQNNEEPEETNDLPNVPRRNPQRDRQLPTRFRQNVADVTVYLVRETAKTPDNKKRGKTATTLKPQQKPRNPPSS